MSKGIIVSPANRGVQVVVTDENNVQLLVDSNRGVNLEVVPQPRIEVLVDKGVEGAQGPVGPQGPQGPQGTAATVTAGTTTTGAAGTNAIVTNSGTSSAAVFDFTIPRGDTGATGATGAGVATGGTTGQVLVKASNVNYDTTWASITGTLVYQGSWNASTNTPTLTSSVGTNGYYYVVGTSGSTNLNGITDWVVGDWAIFNGSVWQKIDNTDLVSSVNGQTGVVVLDAADVGALSNITSTDGSVTITSPNSTTRDLSVAVAGSTTNVLCLVRNTTGATLTKGTVVYISGATGQNPTVSKALATSDATSAQTLGMMTADLPNNSNGYVTVIGLITNMDTSAYTDGQQLYLSGTTAGAVTGTKPYAPIHLVYVAVVEHAHPTQGKLFVKVQNGYELDEIHNVSAQTPTNGQTIVYNSSTQLWEQSNAPVISGTTIDNTVIGGTTPAAGTFTTLTATGQTSLGGVAGAEGLRVTPLASSTTYINARAGVNGGNAQFGLVGTGNTDFIQYTLGTGAFRFLTNGIGVDQMRIAHTASAVNYVQVTGAATGGRVSISSQGSDSSIGMEYTSKAYGTHAFNIASRRQFLIGYSSGNTEVNYNQAQGSNTGMGVQFSVQGSDTNISQVFQSKGTGAIDLAAGSSGVNISNGGTVTAITRTATGSGYTSKPSIAITAPTTAGGVQAVLSVDTMTANTTPTITSGGTGYTNGDVLTAVGGTPTASTLTFTVTAVSGGVITAASTNNAQYSTLPSSPTTVTGGTGTGATFTVSWLVTNLSVTTAGSGYVEQPTVTFSGGGGSGAAAYATVGSGSIIRSLGLTGTQSLSFYTPSGEAVRIRDTGSVGAYSMFTNTAAGTTLVTQGTANAFSALISNGTSSVFFGTNGNTGNTQMAVSHTASAVNYVQVTGAATGANVTISTQGSDASVFGTLLAKGSGGWDITGNGASTFRNAAGANQFRVNPTSSAVNLIQATGAVAGAAPSFTSIGSDTNIDLALITKGTGRIKFGTYTANMALTIQGYIEIVDSGGTVRKLAVIA